MSKGKAPAFQFYVRDWLSDPQLRMASHSTKGIWIDLLCFMWEAPERGTLTGTEIQLAKMVGATQEEFTQFLFEAISLKFADVTDCSGNVTLINRRMKREQKTRYNTRLRVQRHRSNAPSNNDVTPPSSSSSSSSTSRTKELYVETSPEVRLSELLLSKILENQPSFKKPNIQRWAKVVDLTVRIDKRSFTDLEATIEWLYGPNQNGDFSFVVQSPESLRKKFDAIRVQMGRSLSEAERYEREHGLA